MNHKINLVFWLQESCKKYSNKIAFVEQQGKKEIKTTFKEFWNQVVQTAYYLHQKGIRKGNRVILFTPNPKDLHRMIFSLYYIGAVAVFMDAWTTRKRMDIACKITKPKAFIGFFKSHLLRLVSPHVRKIQTKLLIKKHFNTHIADSEFPPVEVTKNHEAIISFTTGSTGIPKAARRSHEFVSNVTFAMQNHHKSNSGDVDMPSLPLFIGNNLIQGVTTVIPAINFAKPADFNPAKVLKQINKNKVMTSLGSPSFFQIIGDYLIKTDQKACFKNIFLGGAPVFPPLAKKLVQAYPDAKVEIVYGSTEAEPMTSISAKDVSNWNILNGLIVGKKVPGIELKILVPVNQPIELKPGETLDKYLAKPGEAGEIVVSGPHVLKEYVDSPQAFKENKIVEGNKVWHRTGDAGKLDQNENLLLFGRMKNRFFQNGLWIYTLPLEQKILEIDAVEFAVVVEINQKVFILIEPKKNITSIKNQNLIDEVKKHLTGIQADEFKIIKKIPRDPRHHSKPNYEELKRILS